MTGPDTPGERPLEPPGPATRVFDFDRIAAIAERQRSAFGEAAPFPHTVIDDFLPVDVAEAVVAEFPSPNAAWTHYHHYNEKKLALKDISSLGAATQAVFAALQSQRFVAILERLTGIERLVSDPDLDGAGMHMIMPGGYLNVHTDFLAHTTRRTWSRQLNLLIYFNKDWRSEYCGDLELWDDTLSERVRAIEPRFNRCVIFHTAEKSFHGHPRPLACPPGMSRKSIALYYFRDEGRDCRLQPTNYQPVPADSSGRRFMIAADRLLLRGYSALKRRGWLTDSMIEKILKRF